MAIRLSDFQKGMIAFTALLGGGALFVGKVTKSVSENYRNQLIECGYPKDSLKLSNLKLADPATIDKLKNKLDSVKTEKFMSMLDTLPVKPETKQQLLRYSNIPVSAIKRLPKP